MWATLLTDFATARPHQVLARAMFTKKNLARKLMYDSIDRAGHLRYK
jgi:hypothetical protein